MKNRIAVKRQTKLFQLIIVMILLLPGILLAQKELPAYQRWGITKPLADKKAETELASAYDLLYRLKFDTAMAIYQKVINQFPKSAEAHLGLSLVYRYLGKRLEAIAECKKALDLDPNAVAAQLNYADLLVPFRGKEIDLALTDSQRVARSIDYCHKALLAKHPLSSYAHIPLFNNYLIELRNWTEARQQLIELGRKGYFPVMLKDFAYNLLNTAAPDAILFTQGDNDTYPLLTLQEYEKVRLDVRVVNINLLNVPHIAGLMRDSLKVPISYNDSVLETISAKYDSVRLRRTNPPQELLIKNIIENARQQNQPVYFSTTVARENIGEYQEYLILEGLAWRVSNIKTKDSTDTNKVIKNMVEKYRLDNLGKHENWLANLSPITRRIAGLGINYLACYNLMAEYYKKQGNNVKVLDSYRQMFRIAEVIDNRNYMKMILDKWFELNPGDPEAEQLKEKYFSH